MTWFSVGRNVALCATTVAMIAAIAPVGPAQSAEPDPELAAVVVPPWEQPQASVTADPQDLAADVSQRERAGVVTLVSTDGRLDVSTVPVRGAEAALATIAAVQDQPGLLAVGVDHRVHSTARATDPMRPRQWGLDLIGAESAWPVANGAGVIVAVVDSGVDGSHPDLRAAMVTGRNTRNDRGDYGSPATDKNGHGTHVAGIIAATAGNGIGVAGVAPGARIMPVKVLDSDGTGWMGDVIEGIVWATDNGAGVINMSLGGPEADFAATAIEYAQSHGVVVVAAAGNEGSSQASYPAALPGVISVAALDEGGTIANYSNWGSTVDIAAPGSGILSTVPSGYEEMSGTSMAAPEVAGVAALIRSRAPAADVAATLAASATDAGAPGRDTHYGAGIVDAAAAVQAACVSCRAAQPASAVTRQAQTVRPPARLRAGGVRRLPASSRQSVTVRSWKSLSPRSCGVRKLSGLYFAVGKAPGTCRLHVAVPGTDKFNALRGSLTVRVTRR